MWPHISSQDEMKGRMDTTYDHPLDGPFLLEGREASNIEARDAGVYWVGRSDNRPNFVGSGILRSRLRVHMNEGYNYFWYRYTPPGAETYRAESYWWHF